MTSSFSSGGRRSPRRWIRRAVLGAVSGLGYDVSRSPADGRFTFRRKLHLTKDPFLAMRTILGGSASCILDVGAHVGETALRLAEVFPKAAIFSFEPDPENFEKLVRNTRATSSIRPVQKAVAAAQGRATLHRTRFTQTHSLLKPRVGAAEFLVSADLLAPEAPVEVETVTLDGFCQLHSLAHVDVLKVDAQGAELAILEGARELLAKRAVTVLLLEVNFVAFYEGTPLFPEVYQALYDLGYRMVCLYDMGFETHYYQVGCNALFVEEEAGRRRVGRS